MSNTSNGVARANIEKLAAAKIPFIEQSRNTLRIVTENGPVMYYPSTNKWQHQGRNHLGDADTLIAWIRRKRPVNVGSGRVVLKNAANPG
jgi:hypothetical protein